MGASEKVQYPVTFFDLRAKNPAGLEGFYTKVSEWKASDGAGDKYRMFETNSEGVGIGGGIGATSDGRSSLTLYI